MCHWTENENGSYETDCGDAFELTSGTPGENGFGWCCYCGRALQQVLFVDHIKRGEHRGGG